jgi:hypothetical protein
MSLKGILEEFSMLSVYEVRRATDEYVEIVFYNKKRNEIDHVLQRTLGPPRKPAGSEPSRDDLNLTREYGGIWLNQTLFVKASEGCAVMAMYWPWEDEVHTTLKMACLKR